MAAVKRVSKEDGHELWKESSVSASTQRSSAYTNLRVEEVPGFRYVKHTVISTEPESDALDRVSRYAKENGIDHPSVIGWDFPRLSMEQICHHPGSLSYFGRLYEDERAGVCGE